jgi:hypothetical protein
MYRALSLNWDYVDPRLVELQLGRVTKIGASTFSS